MKRRHETTPVSRLGPFLHGPAHTRPLLLDAHHMMDTRCAEHFPDVAAAAEKAHQALFDFYQLIGPKYRGHDCKTYP
jgi:hypothetical protein